MRKLLHITLPAVIAAVIVASVASAGPGLGITIDTNSMTGNGSSGNALGVRRDCGAGQILKWSGAAWGCASDDSGGGTISGVTAGNGLTGGGTSGTVTLDVGCGTGIQCNSNDVTLNMSGASCTNNQVMTALGATGTGTCAAPPAFTSIANGYTPASGGGTTNYLRADGSWTSPPGTTYSAGTGLSLGGTTFSANLAGASCSAGSFVSAISASGTGTCTAESVGTITNVVAGTGLSGGGSSGSVTLDVNCLIGLVCNANNINISNRDWGDITSSGSTGVVWTIDNDVVTYAKMQNISATSRFLGRITAGAGDPEELTGTQATTLLDAFTSSLKGLAPASGGGTTNFLRADGTWAAPPGGGGISGSGTTNQIPLWTSSGTQGDSAMFQDANHSVFVQTPLGGAALNVAGAINATGGTSWIQAGAQVYAYSGNTTLQNKGISFDYNTNGVSGGFINAVGYADGTTQFRNLEIDNGKGAAIATFTGSSKQVDFAGQVTATTGFTTVGPVVGGTVIGRYTTKPSCTAPTLTCGSSPNIVGCDSAGTVIVGTGSPGTCTITFANAFTGTGGYPTCTVTAQNGTAKSYSVSTTAIVINSPVSSTKYDFICVDH